MSALRYMVRVSVFDIGEPNTRDAPPMLDLGSAHCISERMAGPLTRADIQRVTREQAEKLADYLRLPHE